MTPVDNLWITLWITGLSLWITLWITCGKPGGDWRLWITGQLSTAYPQGGGGLSTEVIHRRFSVQERAFSMLSTYPQALLLLLRIFKDLRNKEPVVTAKGGKAK